MDYMILTYRLFNNGTDHVTRYNLNNLADTTRANSLMRDLIANRLMFSVSYLHV